MAKRRAATIARAKSKPIRSNQKDELGPWGSELYPTPPDPGFAHAGLFIPRQGRVDQDSTFSPAASIRYSAVSGQPLHVRKPLKDSNTVLQSLGLVSGRYPHKLGDGKTTRTGVFSSFESLGMSAAFFRDDGDMSRALNELNDEYEFVPDFALSLPLRVTSHDYPTNRRYTPREAREWPVESGVTQAHKRGVFGADVLVAVLDTGVDADHAEFAGKRINFRHVSPFPQNPNWPPRDVRGFDANGHGTHVCGILAGKSVGVAPEAELYVASVIESESVVTSATRVVAGLQWVLRQFTRPDNERKPGILSMSLGFPTMPDDGTVKLRYETMALLMRALRQANVLPVVAVGNSGQNEFGYPAALADVIGVGAVSFQEAVASFSGSTPAKVTPAKPDLVGYGVGVDSAIERDYDNRSVYQRMSGTSMATPYVAAITALYRSRAPGLSVDEVQNELFSNARTIEAVKSRRGNGLAIFK